MLFVFSASAGTMLKLETVPEGETEKPIALEDLTNIYTQIQITDQEIEVNLDHLISVLQSLDMHLIVINEILSSHVEEYPSLQPLIKGTTEGIEIVDSMIVFLESDPEKIREDVGNVKVTMNSLNEIMLQVKSDLEYVDRMIKVLNSTIAESNIDQFDITEPIFTDIFMSIKQGISILEQF